MPLPPLLSRVLGAATGSFRDAIHVSLGLFRVMVPIIIAVKILAELDLIRYLALPLEPVMHLVGLPPDLGLAWATGMAVNIYSGLLVFASLMTSMEPLSGAQATVFATMMLIAHSLPVEGRIAQQCGVRMVPQLVIRIACAIVCGFVLHRVYSATGWLADPATMLWEPRRVEPGLIPWGLNELRNLFSLFWVIFVLMLFKRALDHFDVTPLLNAALRPVLRLLGIGPNAATITVVGMCMGIIYGSGLIIREVNKGTLDKHDVFCSITLMGLAHALIEDTLLMVLIGGDVTATLGGRLLFALLFVAVIGRLTPRGASPAPVRSV